MRSRININNNTVIGFAIFFYYSALRLTDLGESKNTLYFLSLVLLAAAAAAVHRSELRIRINRLHIYILVFAAFTYLSSFWAAKPGLTIPKFNRLIFILGEMLIIAMLDGGRRNVELMLKCIMYGGYAIVFYIILHSGWSSIISILADSKRLANDLLNANYLGMAAAYSIIINFYLILYVNRRIGPLDLLAVPTAAVLLASGSRKALVVLALGFVGLYLMRKWDDKKAIRSFLKILLLVPFLALGLYLVSRLPAFSGINTRMNDLIKALTGDVTRKNSAWLRMQYNKLGMELFRANPLRGVGIGNSNYYTLPLYGHDHYLHNNYAELLACGGLIGFTIYYSIFAAILFTMIKYRKHRTREYDVCLVLLVIWLIMDYGCVRYFARETYLFLTVFSFEARNLRESRLRMTPDPEGEAPRPAPDPVPSRAFFDPALTEASQ